MTTHSTRSWVTAAALALCGIAMVATAGCGTPASAASLRQWAPSAGQQAAGPTAVSESRIGSPVNRRIWFTVVPITEAKLSDGR